MSSRDRDVGRSSIVSEPADLADDALTLWDEDKLRLLAREPDLQRQAEIWERVMSEIVWGIKA